MSEQAGRRPGGRRRPGALESAVWTVLHRAGRALSAEEVRAELGGELAHTTVVTTLSRLYGKGMLTRQLDGRAHRYAPAASQEGIAAARMHRALSAEPDREAVLSSFVSDLSDGDEALLRRLLAADARPVDARPVDARPVDTGPEGDGPQGRGRSTSGRSGPDAWGGEG